MVARLAPEAIERDLEWLVHDGAPFESVDPLDFLDGPEIRPLYELYRTEYVKLDSKLNVQMPEALLEYNRWVVIVGEKGEILAFACFKTTQSGLKLGLAANDGAARGKSALKSMLRAALNVDGVYAEVSDRLELSLAGYVPEVLPELVGGILGKLTTENADGRHYSRDITNVGRKTKLMVGRPFRPEPQEDE